jgi:hypothetical protein
MRRKFETYPELMAEYRRLKCELGAIKNKNERLKKKYEIIEQKAESFDNIHNEYVFIDKKPDYFFSFSGHALFRQFYLRNGLTAAQAELLIIISYKGVFLRGDFRFYNRDYFKLSVIKLIETLIEQRYVMNIMVPGKAHKKRNGYVLTQKGKDLEADYEQYYDKKMDELRSGRITPANFQDGAYFRKVFVSRYERRIEQGGGMLIRGGIMTGWKESPPIWKHADEMDKGE